MRGIVATSLMAFLLGATPVAAQDTSITYSAIDRATVRVFAVAGVGAVRVTGDTSGPRMLAVPVTGHGSGFLVSEDGLVITADHVVDDAVMLAVLLPNDGGVHRAEVVYRDAEHDLAVLVLEGSYPDHVTLAPPATPLRIRQTIHAIGYPLDPRRTDPQSSTGTISGLLPSGELQLDIGVNPGNSGGPVINEAEEVVGLVFARGRPEAGVASLAFATPVERIIPVLDTARASTALTEARARLAAEHRDTEIAQLVTLLVRVGGLELIREIISVLEEGGASEILPQLRTLAAESTDPEVLVLAAAYFWDAAAVILERNGGVMRASELPPGANRDLADELLRRAVALCVQAGGIDPLILRRSPFASRLVYYFRDSAAPSTAVAVAPSTSAAATPGPSRSAAYEPEPAPRRPPGPYDPRLWLTTGPSLVITNEREVAAAGFDVHLGVYGSPYTLRAGPVAADVLIGASLRTGYWSGYGGRLTIALLPELGVMLRLGGDVQAVVGSAWTPGFAFLASTSGVLGGWRAYVGVQSGSILVLLGWRGIQTDQTAAYHELELGVGWGFF